MNFDNFFQHLFLDVDDTDSSVCGIGTTYNIEVSRKYLGYCTARKCLLKSTTSAITELIVDLH